MLKLDVTRQVRKFLDTLPPKQFRQVVNKILSLMMDPMAWDSKKLEGYHYYRVDVGEYRIIYRVEGDCLKVALAGKRNDRDVYEQLKNK